MVKCFSPKTEHFEIGDINDFPELSPEDDIFSGTSSNYVKSDSTSLYNTYDEFIRDVDSGPAAPYYYDEW